MSENQTTNFCDEKAHTTDFCNEKADTTNFCNEKVHTANLCNDKKRTLLTFIMTKADTTNFSNGWSRQTYVNKNLQNAHLEYFLASPALLDRKSVV